MKHNLSLSTTAANLTPQQRTLHRLYAFCAPPGQSYCDWVEAFAIYQMDGTAPVPACPPLEWLEGAPWPLPKQT